MLYAVVWVWAIQLLAIFLHFRHSELEQRLDYDWPTLLQRMSLFVEDLSVEQIEQFPGPCKWKRNWKIWMESAPIFPTHFLALMSSL